MINNAKEDESTVWHNVPGGYCDKCKKPIPITFITAHEVKGKYYCSSCYKEVFAMLPEVMANFFLNAGLFFAKISEKYQDEQQKYCIAACIFFCIASIEAYLNFLADDFIKKDIGKEPKNKIGPIYVDLFREKESKVNKKDGGIEQQSKYVNILDKLYLWPKIVTGTTFDKGAKPYKDFQKLVEFRDKMTHYKLKEAEPIPSISDAPDSVENIFSILSQEGLLYDNDVYHELTREKAQEALKTTYQVLKDLYGFYGYKDSWTRHGLKFLNGLLEVSADH